MACVDVDALTQYETDARQGRADALYNLGLAYSTGQGVDVDFVAAHKWFNLAAMKGVELAKNWRAQISREMNTNQIAEAQRLAREWLSIFH
jgi:TPR repeat protein